MPCKTTNAASGNLSLCQAHMRPGKSHQGSQANLSSHSMTKARTSNSSIADRQSTTSDGNASIAGWASRTSAPVAPSTCGQTASIRDNSSRRPMPHCIEQVVVQHTGACWPNKQSLDSSNATSSKQSRRLRGTLDSQIKAHRSLCLHLPCSREMFNSTCNGEGTASPSTNSAEGTASPSTNSAGQTMPPQSLPEPNSLPAKSHVLHEAKQGPKHQPK